MMVQFRITASAPVAWIDRAVTSTTSRATAAVSFTMSRTYQLITSSPSTRSLAP